MNMTDPVADMLTRIRNANRAFRSDVEIPHSKLKAEIAKVLGVSRERVRQVEAAMLKKIRAAIKQKERARVMATGEPSTDAKIVEESPKKRGPKIKKNLDQ